MTEIIDVSWTIVNIHFLDLDNSIQKIWYSIKGSFKIIENELIFLFIEIPVKVSGFNKKSIKRYRFSIIRLNINSLLTNNIGFFTLLSEWTKKFRVIIVKEIFE